MLTAIGFDVSAMLVGQLALDTRMAIVGLSLSLIASCAVFVYKRSRGGSEAFVVGMQYTLRVDPFTLPSPENGRMFRRCLGACLLSLYCSMRNACLRLVLWRLWLGSYAMKRAKRGAYRRRLRNVRQIQVSRSVHTLVILATIATGGFL